jgi:hypothetical protein
MLGPQGPLPRRHTHQWLRHMVAGRLHVWAPTTRAVLPDAVSPPVGQKRPGVLDVSLGDDGASAVAVRRPPGIHARVTDVDVA